jgi:hypothetical protein
MMLPGAEALYETGAIRIDLDGNQGVGIFFTQGFRVFVDID